MVKFSFTKDERSSSCTINFSFDTNTHFAYAKHAQNKESKVKKSKGHKTHLILNI